MWLLVPMPSVAYCMLRFIVRKYAEIAVNLGCWIPRPPCSVYIEASRAECSGIVLLDTKDNRTWDYMPLKSKHKSPSRVFQFRGWFFSVRTSAPNRCVIFYEAQNLSSWSADFLLGKRSKMILLCSCTLLMALETNSCRRWRSLLLVHLALKYHQ